MSTPVAVIEIPDFSLDSSSGERISRGDYRGELSLVLVFVPELKTSANALLSLQERIPDFGLAKSRVLAVAPEPVDKVKAFAGGHGIEIPLLADEAGLIARSLNLTSACHPIVLVADRDGVVRESVTFPNVHIEGVLDRVRRLSET